MHHTRPAREHDAEEREERRSAHDGHDHRDGIGQPQQVDDDEGHDEERGQPHRRIGRPVEHPHRESRAVPLRPLATSREERDERQPGDQDHPSPGENPCRARDWRGAEHVRADVDVEQRPEAAHDAEPHEHLCPGQWAAPAEPTPRLLCMSGNSARDKTNTAPNKRKSCSNDSIIACRVTMPLRNPIALVCASAGTSPRAINACVIAPSRSRVASAYGVTLAARSALWIAVNRCNSVAEIAMPTLPPSCRIRLKSPVPFGIFDIGRSASARFVSGTKIRPSPTPRKMSGQKKSDMPLSVVKCACFHIESAKTPTPAVIDNRASNFPVVRPITAIVNALARAPGRITKPV